MSTKKTPTKSAPKKRVKPRDGATMADYLEPIEPASPAGDIEVVGTTSRPDGFGVRGVHTGGGVGVRGESRTGFAVVGITNPLESTTFITAAVHGLHFGAEGEGVRGKGAVGVVGESSKDGSVAVKGDHTGAGVGVVGDVAKAGAGTAGVLGRHKGADGTGVRGEGTTGIFGQGKFTGVRGNSEATGVRGEGGSIGVVGQGKVVGVSGICTDSAAGTSGPGVRGVGHYGGQFQGTSAQLHLRPGTSVGRPTTGQHSKGEIFMDQDGTLFVCVADGTPGTWLRVMTQPA
jgi:hypothetical protein